MKKKNSLGKIVSVMLLLVLLAAAGFVFVTYRKINNSKQYEEAFFAGEAKEYEFKDLVTYSTSTHIAHMEVPRDALKKFTEDVLGDVSLPFGLTMDRIGLILNDDQTISIVPEIRYKNLIATCPLINLSYEVQEDHIDFIYEGIYLLNNKLSKLINDRSGLEIGSTITSVDFPDIIMDFHQCPFMLEYVSNIECDGETVSCDYDIYHAMLELYKTDSTTGEENPMFQENIRTLKNLANRGFKIVE